jgi:putative hemolysin
VIPIRFLFAALLFAVAAPAQAYCVFNGLKDRHIAVVQEEHPERSRDARKLNIVMKPGENHCCNFWNLDCNPGGREEAVVGLAIKVVEEPEVVCGLPGGRYKEHQVSVTGTSNVRVLPNNRRSEEIPYVVRVRARDGKDLTGPAGIACRKPRKD